MSGRTVSSRRPVGGRSFLSAAVGIVAFVVGYVLTVAVLILDVVLDGGNGANGGRDLTEQAVELFGALFLNAHYVTMDLDVHLDLYTGPDTRNLIAEIEHALPDIAYYAVPVVVVFFGGVLAAWLARDWIESPVGAALWGASLVVCYLPLVALATTVSSFHGTYLGTAFTVSPPVVQSVLQAGVVYPVVLGALGGLAFYGTRRRRLAP